MKLAFDCDEAGLPLKQVILEHLRELGVDAVDLNLLAERKADYPDIGHNLAKRVAAKEFERGILVCGTGLGMAMVANKVEGVFAGTCHDTYSAERLCKSNAAQVLTFGARVIGPELAKTIVSAWIHSRFEGGRSQPKVERMRELERQEVERSQGGSVSARSTRGGTMHGLERRESASLTPRERVRRAINFEEADRVPFDFGGTKETGIHMDAYLELGRHLGLDVELPKVYDQFQMLARVEEPVRRRLHADVVQVENLVETWGLANRNWRVCQTGCGNEVLMPGGFKPVKDERGYLVLRDASGQVIAEMAPGGLYFDRATPTGRSEEIVFMDPAAWKQALPLYRDEELEVLQKRARLLRDYTDYSVHGGFNKFKMHSSGLIAGHTFTDWMCLLVTEKDYVCSILQATAERNIENLKLYFEAVGDCIDTVLISTTDYGTQQGELINPLVFKELYLPHMKQVNDFVHSYGHIKTMYHSCGSIRHLIECFIQGGVDLLNPLQVNTANMDPRELKAEFGGRIVFWGGGVDTQTTYQFGTPDEVREQVRERIEVFAPGGGYVFSTSHNTQYRVPPANIVAMADAVVECGGYRNRPGAR